MKVPDIEVQIIVDPAVVSSNDSEIGILFADVVFEARKFTEWFDWAAGKQGLTEVEAGFAYEGFCRSIATLADSRRMDAVVRLGQFYGGGWVAEHFRESELVEVSACLPVSLRLKGTTQ